MHGRENTRFWKHETDTMSFKKAIVSGSEEILSSLRSLSLYRDEFSHTFRWVCGFRVQFFNPKMETIRKIYPWMASNMFFTEVPTDSASFYQDTLTSVIFLVMLYFRVIRLYLISRNLKF